MSFAKICMLMLLVAAQPLSVLAAEQPAPRAPVMMGPGGGMAGQGGPRQGMGPGMAQAPRPFAGVQFNEKQRKRIQEMMALERKTHQKRMEKMQKVQQQLQKLYSADKWDTRAITSLYEKMHAEQRKTIAAMADARNKVYEMMTKEQRQQMKQFQQEQMKRFAAPSQPPQPPQ